MKKILALFVVSLCLCACGHSMKSAVKDGVIAPSFNDTLVDNNYLWVRGFGAANPNHTSDSQRRIMSREAAIAHAYQRATEVIYGANLESNVEIVDAVSTGSTINSSAQGLLNGMELISSEYLEDGGASVIMRLNRERLKAAGIELPKSK